MSFTCSLVFFFFIVSMSLPIAVSSQLVIRQFFPATWEKFTGHDRTSTRFEKPRLYCTIVSLCVGTFSLILLHFILYSIFFLSSCPSLILADKYKTHSFIYTLTIYFISFYCPLTHYISTICTDGIEECIHIHMNLTVHSYISFFMSLFRRLVCE